MTGARIDDHKGATCLIDFDVGARDDPDEAIIHRSPESTPVEYKFDFVIEHMRDGFGEVFLIGIPTLAHHVQVQDAALKRIDHEFDGRGTERIEEWEKSIGPCFHFNWGHSLNPPVSLHVHSSVPSTKDEGNDNCYDFGFRGMTE
jgi:hypothetical protein